VRANAIVLISAVSAYARNRPPLRTPARQCRVSCNAGAFRPPGSPTANSRHYVVFWRSLRVCERPGRHGGSLAAADELRPALLTKVVKLYGSYAALNGARRRPKCERVCDTLDPDAERRLPHARPMTVARIQSHGVLAHELLSVCEVA
jgi:hypothetical protein